MHHFTRPGHYGVAGRSGILLALALALSGCGGGEIIAPAGGELGANENQGSGEGAGDAGQLDATDSSNDEGGVDPNDATGGNNTTPIPDTGASHDSGGVTPDVPEPPDASEMVDAPEPVVEGSAGCGLAGPTVGERTLTVGSDVGSYVVTIPSGYDPGQPYPVGFGFHGHGRTHLNCQAGDCAGFDAAMREQAILVYMKSFGDGWQQQDVRDRNATFFAALLDTLEAEFCVDVDKVFVAGTSSGATFSNILACRYGDRILATVPVAGGIPEREGCVGEVAALVIHGVDDPHVPFPNGEQARDHYRAANGCTETTVPELGPTHDAVVAERESHGCVDYQGCEPGLLVRWCEHSEGGYDGSTHGWPLFAGDAIWSFVGGL